MEHDYMGNKTLSINELRGLFAAMSEQGKQHLDAVAKRQKLYALMTEHQLNKETAAKRDGAIVNLYSFASQSDIDRAVL
jgi:hypothetical protein